MSKGLIFIVFFFTMNVAYADQDALSSPYFIDEIHCQGLAEHDGPTYWFLSQEEAEAQKLIEAQEDCHDLFKSFGIEKYGWISPEDLERTSAHRSCFCDS